MTEESVAADVGDLRAVEAVTASAALVLVLVLVLGLGSVGSAVRVLPADGLGVVVRRWWPGRARCRPWTP
ncbi:hypothetical protein [Streptomyces monashensis]|uniref:Uncharacterized protein n=1 Tax=Streptomyces monashensis TaxID=1678012 RepID=A0A1S2Q4G5_9ACTN|nr:hypothetical protein [Streptomyces monashensis]OIK01029.1 hypothetical protein BIV23_26800 [Streptomyces monashensis]